MSKKKAIIRNMEYLKYELEMDDEAKAWVRQFYNEYYAKGSYSQEDPILTSDEHLVEA